MDRENSEVEMEMQRKERLNEKESREARKTARRKSIEVWATDCERAVEPINRADFMSGFDDGWLSAIKYASQQRWVEVADQGEIHAEATSEFCDVSVWLSRFDMDTATLPELREFEAECDEAIDAIERAKATARAKRRAIEVERDKTRTLAPPAEVAKFKGNGTK